MKLTISLFITLSAFWLLNSGHYSLLIFGYYLWLTKEIIQANITVIKHIWLGKKSISPTLKKIKISQQTDMGKVIYANSITLTPGTVAIDLVDDEIIVHALLYKDVESLEIGEMDRRVTMLER